MNAASDDESGSSAADSQVWSAGRQSDRSGDLVDSTGTEITTTARGSVNMTNRQSNKDAKLTKVSVLVFLNKGWFKVSPRSEKFSDVLVSRASKSGSGPETVTPDWIKKIWKF